MGCFSSKTSTYKVTNDVDFVRNMRYKCPELAALWTQSDPQEWDLIEWDRRGTTLARVLKLRLTNIGLAELPSEIFNLTALRELNVSGNNLASLPSSIGQLTELRKFVLCERDDNNSALTALPDSITRCAKLEELILGASSIVSLPASIGNLKELRHLSVRGSKHLELLPDSVVQCSALTEINIAFTSIKSLPESIGDLRKLETLCAASTKLSSLPVSISNCPLKLLAIEGCEFETFPEIVEIRTLERLWAHNNRIMKLPESIGNMYKLEILTLQGNRLASVPVGLASIDASVVVDLTGNPKLKFVPPEVMSLDSVKLDKGVTKGYTTDQRINQADDLAGRVGDLAEEAIDAAARKGKLATKAVVMKAAREASSMASILTGKKK
tara:strand:+ start:1513 stop:2664 length:1152 start_codon:yes stop_codon:yes gene_type:complete